MKSKALKIFRSIFAVITVFSLLVTGMPVIALDGDTAEFKEIRTIEELYNIRDDLTANYKLMNDIDLTEATAKGGAYDFMGNGWNPIGSNDIYSNAAFSGTFDGNGYSIRGLRINITNTPSGTGDTIYVGLFSNVSGCVKNLSISGSISISLNPRNTYCGSVAAYCSGTISNYSNACSITVNGGNKGSCIGYTSYIGGVVGYSTAELNLCSNNSTISTGLYGSDSSNSSAHFTAGIAGYSLDGSLNQCYNLGDIVANDYGYQYYSNYAYLTYSYVSGVSYGSARISNCYNTGTITVGYNNICNGCSYGIGIGRSINNSYNIGKITGSACAYGIGYAVTNSYYLFGVGSSSTGATALTDEQMRLQSIEVVPATAEDGKIVLSDSATVSGKCTSFVDDDESVTIRLFRKGESEPCSETTVTGDSGKYSFEGVTAGAYIIEASAESHNTFSKEINVSRPVTVDITLYISCDADGDGEVTMKDVLLMRKFIAGIISEDGIVMGGADYNGDGDVTMADVLVIRKIIAGII